MFLILHNLEILKLYSLAINNITLKKTNDNYVMLLLNLSDVKEKYLTK